MYVDESGDPGLVNSPTRYYVLSAITFHESFWQTILDDLILFRRELKKLYGLKMKEEIHSSIFINGRTPISQTIYFNIRLTILKRCMEWLNNRNDVSVFSVRCDKLGKTVDVFDYTWKVLIQRFDNTLAARNFPGPRPLAGIDKGIILSDNTNGGKLTRLLRTMRRYNPVPHIQSLYGPGYTNMRLRAIVEDPVMRDSANSYFHQMSDVVAYFARQYFEPNKHIRRKGARNYYGHLSRVINPHVTRQNSNYRIVLV